ncbi:MAG: peptidase U32 family protein [Candidatus Staskawiczbacteria bacterium]
MKKPELLAPIQDYTSLSAAINNGADAVFFGIKGFNMRAGAKNFTMRDLPKISRIAKEGKIKTYLAINTIIHQEDIKKLEKILKKIKETSIDAIICWDPAVIQIAKKLKIEVHISTQASVANSEAANLYKKLGAKRVVLARECSLKQIKKIKKETNVEIEVFIHGAMCVSISGRCFISQFLSGKSANCGECQQPCRQKYLIKQINGGKELEIGKDYVLSPKDLCTLGFIENILEVGVDCLKIEGRNRSPEYVATVTKSYRTVIDFYYKNKKKKHFKEDFEKLKKKSLKELKTVFHRGQSSGFYMNKPLNEWVKSDGNQATEIKERVGIVSNCYNKIGVAEILIQGKKTIKIGDELLFQGPNTGSLRNKIISLEIEHKAVKIAKNVDKVATKTISLVRKNDVVFLIKKS